MHVIQTMNKETKVGACCVLVGELLRSFKINRVGVCRLRLGHCNWRHNLAVGSGCRVHNLAIGSGCRVRRSSHK